ncbi:MAG: T9SS type A sorting domain-containing protein [Bacteroidota bacterium]|jgi:hypothetical protein
MKKIFLLFSLQSCLFVFSQWSQQSSGFVVTRGINSINIVNDSVVWAGAYDGTNTTNYITEYTKTSNSGMSWITGIINTGLIGAGLANISAYDKDTAWSCIFHPTQATAGGIWKTTNGGISWIKQNTAAYAATSFPNFVHFWDSNRGITMGDPINGYFEVYTTNDGGANWIRTPNTSNQLSSNAAAEYGYTNVFSVSGHTLWFGTSTGRVFKTTDFGISFTNATPLNGVTDIQRITFSDSLIGYACMHTAGNKSWKIAKTIDGGTTWSALQNNTVINNTTILGADICVVPGTNSLISVGSDASAIGSSYSFDGGLNWSLMEDTSLAPQRLSVRFLNATTGWTGGFNTSSTTSGIFKFQGTVGIENNHIQNRDVLIFPNPASDKLNIQYFGFIGKNLEIKICSTEGKNVFSQRDKTSDKIYSSEIDLTNFLPGIYIVSVFDGENIVRKKLIVQ